jgi:hypothetical protein
MKKLGKMGHLAVEAERAAGPLFWLSSDKRGSDARGRVIAEVRGVLEALHAGENHKAIERFDRLAKRFVAPARYVWRLVQLGDPEKKRSRLVNNVAPFSLVEDPEQEFGLEAIRWLVRIVNDGSWVRYRLCQQCGAWFYRTGRSVRCSRACTDRWWSRAWRQHNRLRRVALGHKNTRRMARR